MRRSSHECEDGRRNFTPESDRRFLLIKAWGFGFWSDVSQVLGSLLLAEITERIPVTHWGGKSLYAIDSNRDAFTAYFEPLSTFTIDHLVGLPEPDFFPSKWATANLLNEVEPMWWGDDPARVGESYLRRPERIAVVDSYIGVIDVMESMPDEHECSGQSVKAVYQYLVAKYLRPRSQIIAEVNGFFQRYIAGSPAIAVHVRGLDKKFEAPDIDTINALYFDILDREEAFWRILLITDDAHWSESFRKRYGDRVILTDSQRETGDTGIHCSRTPSIDRTKLGFEVMRDTYLACRCDKFLGNGLSNLSAMVEVLKPWKRGACTLLAPSPLFSERNIVSFIVNRSHKFAGTPTDKEAHYRLGEELDFSDPEDSRMFMRDGWSVNEDWGTWTIGSPAELSLILDGEQNKPLILHVLVQPFLARLHDRLSVGVSVCGEEIAEWIFTLNDSRKQGWRKATIPPPRDPGINRALRIGFNIKTPMSPASLGLSEDQRLLGLGFSRLIISEQPNGSTSYIRSPLHRAMRRVTKSLFGLRNEAH
jgi:hypothetical protein